MPGKNENEMLNGRLAELEFCAPADELMQYLS
jgi:hypothetical protein